MNRYLISLVLAAMGWTMCAAPALHGADSTPAAEGELVLTPAEATVHGQTIRYEKEKNCIGYWTNAGDWVSWTLQIPKPGKYEVELTAACGKGSGGSQYTLSVGDQKLSAKMAETGSFKNFTKLDLGSVEVAQGGEVTVSVKVTAKPGLAVMDIRQITLRPAK